MHNNFPIVIYCLVLSVFMSCENKESISDLVEINIEENIKNIKPLNICDFNCEIEYVSLQTDSILLSTIILSDFSKDLILVGDNNYNCILFDSQGNRIVKVGNKGKGPGEYLNIRNIEIGPENNIYLQSWGDILNYDKDGNFLRRIKLELNNLQGRMICWTLINDSLFIGQLPNKSGMEKFKAVFFNDEGIALKFVKNNCFINKVNNATFSNESHASIYQLRGNVFFKEVVNDTVYNVNDQYMFEPAYRINLGKYQQPKAHRELPMMEMIKTYNQYIYILDIYESFQYVFLNCIFGEHTPAKRSEPLKIEGTDSFSLYYTSSVLGVYDKTTKELVFAKPEKIDNKLRNSGLHNDYDGGVNFYPEQMINDSTLAMWVNAFQLKEHVASDYFKNSIPKYPEKKKELEKLANSLSENDNPVLILVTFK